jgi:dephospho-CoA kinase
MVETVKDFYLIGLTGNLGCGKSTVRRMLEQLGARGIDADLLAHVAMERGTPAWNAIIKSFGADVLRYDGEIDRQHLGKQVFENPEALNQLEGIVHPAVGELVKEILRENQKSVVVLEAIKLIESGLYQWCDALWVVTCPSEVQVERVVRDRQMRPEDAQARLAAQSAENEKTRLANIVIDNSGDAGKTRAQVEKAWAETVHVESARDKTGWLFDELAQSEPSAPLPPVAEATVEPPTPPPATEPPPAPEAPVEPPTPAPPSVPIAPQDAEPPAAPAAKLEQPVTEARVEPEAPTPPQTPVPPSVAETGVEPAALTPPQTPVPPPAIEPPIPTPPPARVEPPAPVPSPEESGRPVAPAPPPPAASKETTEETAPTPVQRPTAAAQKPRPPQGNLIVQVRPARRSDLDALSVALAQAEGRREPLSAAETLKRLGERGYRIALAQGRIVAMAAWEAENLVAITRDIRAASPEIARQAFPPLLSLIEQDANSLVCEVSILLTDARTPSVVANAATASGYRMSDLDALHKVWRQVISERFKAGEKIWVKPLRKELITKPVE